MKLRYAVKIGKVKKPNYCSKCKFFCSPGKLFGHHDDYNKPFEVRWLCPRCHELTHYPNSRSS